MQKVFIPTTTHPIKAYISLIKPGIIIGNAITAISGFILASKGEVDPKLFFFMLLGLSLIIASACSYNNYIDRDADQKMQRTQNRSLAKGVITPQSALFFGTTLGLVGIFVLSCFVNAAATWIACLGHAIYVFVYSFMKYRSSYATLIGSIGGALPPVVGYTAVTGQIDTAALLLFTTIVFWQMPHFFAIAIYRLEDYAKASIPVLPLEKGIKTTKIQMLIYSIAFTLASSSLTACGFVSKTYLLISLCLGVTWSLLCVKGFKCGNDRQWARKMFLFSLLVVMGISIAIPFCI